MTASSKIMRNLFLIGVIALIAGLGAPPASAQIAPERPVMQNTFYNVIWGSVLGVLLGASSAAVSEGTDVDSEDLRLSVIRGATFGGLMGLGLGIWLTFNGITFDENRSLLLGDVRENRGPATMARVTVPPIEFETAPGKPFQITGAKALILDMRF